jgi:serine/threonine-protein kinase
VVRELLAQAADAIGAAHRAGIVHRDVKPANLLVTPDRKIKITDFGIARASDGLGLTGTGQVMGTPQYLAPEQARGQVATPASDVYSLGVVAFECLAGHRPFDADSPVATALAHLNDPVPDLPSSVPSDLAGVVRRAMAKDPAQRYADGEAFAAALRDPTAGATTAYVPVAPAGDQTQVLGTVPPVPPTGPTPVEEDERRSRWPIVLLVLGLVAAIVLIAVLVATAGDDDEPTTTEPTTSAPTTSAPTTEDTPTEETTSAPAEVQIDEDDYLGRPVDDVVAELRDLGLRVETQPVDNPGDEEADTVASVRPTGTLAEGDTVTVEYYREAEPTEEPSETSTPTPSDTATPSAPATSGEASASPSPSQAQGSQSPSAAGSPSTPSAPTSGRVGSR